MRRNVCRFIKAAPTLCNQTLETECCDCLKKFGNGSLQFLGRTNRLAQLRHDFGLQKLHPTLERFVHETAPAQH